MKVTLLSLLPKDIAPLVANIPSVALNQIPWRKLLVSVRSAASVYLSGNVPKETSIELESILKERIDTISPHGEKGEDFGNDALFVYFSQLASKQGLILDLRKSAFSQKRNKTIWAPQPIFHKFAPGFQASLRNLYRGYYLNRTDLFNSAIRNLGLTKEDSEEELNKVKELLFSHFGESQNEVKFEMKAFSTSFTDLFEYIAEKEIEVSVDFAFLGIYLVSLYSHLSSYDRSFDVRKAFIDSKIGSDEDLP